MGFKPIKHCLALGNKTVRVPLLVEKKLAIKAEVF